MSVQSLPQLNGSGGAVIEPFTKAPPAPMAPLRKGSSSSVDQKSKYNSLPTHNKGLERPPSKFDEVLQKRQRLNRNGSIGNLQFRGIKKEFLEKQTSMICHSMTVCGVEDQLCDR